MHVELFQWAVTCQTTCFLLHYWPEMLVKSVRSMWDISEVLMQFWYHKWDLKCDVLCRIHSTACSWSGRDCCSTNRNVCAVKLQCHPFNSKHLEVVLAHYSHCCLEQIPATMLRPRLDCQRRGQKIHNSWMWDVLAVLVSALLIVCFVHWLSQDSRHWTCAVNVDVMGSECPMYRYHVVNLCISSVMCHMHTHFCICLSYIHLYVES